MPELPEVETTRRGLLTYLKAQKICKVTVRNRHLRWPVHRSLAQHLKGQCIEDITRRAKYLLFPFPHGHLIVHLGMSGSLRVCSHSEPLKKHDHIILDMENQKQCRYHDPRRFGSWIWTSDNPAQHRLLHHLGKEPLERAFHSQYLWQQCLKRKIAIKKLLMDHTVVVGVGNIYANEALFLAHIHPLQPCHSLTKQHCDILVPIIKKILRKAIQVGGTTLRDFVSGNNQAGYFQQQLYVYNRDKQACQMCDTTIQRLVIAQRASFFCPQCQSQS